MSISSTTAVPLVCLINLCCHCHSDEKLELSQQSVMNCGPQTVAFRPPASSSNITRMPRPPGPQGTEIQAWSQQSPVPLLSQHMNQMTVSGNNTEWQVPTIYLTFTLFNGSPIKS